MLNWPLKPFILAHRGARSRAPENTIEAFRKACAMGADGIECDVFLSRDGYPVVIHDAKLNRTTSGKGFVRDFDVRDLQGFGVPLLEEVLHVLPNNAVINIELKESKPYPAEYLANQICLLLKSYWGQLGVIISSFDTELLEIWSRESYPVGILFEKRAKICLPKFWRPDALHVDYRDREKVPEGLKTVLWTAPDVKTARKWISEGADGVIAEF